MGPLYTSDCKGWLGGGGSRDDTDQSPGTGCNQLGDSQGLISGLIGSKSPHIQIITNLFGKLSLK